MKKYICSLFTIALTVVLITSGSVQAQLSLSLRFTKSAYELGSPVSCVIALKNTSATALVVNNRFLVNLPTGPREIALQVIDPSLQVVPFTSRVNASSETDKYIVLQPGSSTSITYTLTDDYELVAKGKYSVTAYYENRFEAPTSSGLSAAWKGRLKSNKASFTLR